MAAVLASPHRARSRAHLGPFVRVLHGMAFWSGEMIRPPEAAAGMALMAVILLIVNGHGPEPAG